MAAQTNQSPKVSVVIPCFNAERYVGHAIESALRQLDVPVEVILVDDGSSDATLRIAAQIAARDGRLRIYKNPENRGPSYSRNRGIDEVRALRENARFAPARARYKIYIIDEVHMLTEHAFNALLKTLEEPPEHVKFIMATTEPHKIPITIHSRCQRFDFRNKREKPKKNSIPKNSIARVNASKEPEGLMIRMAPVNWAITMK